MLATTALERVLTSSNRLGLAVLSRNYLDVYPYDTWGDRSIPDFQEGQEFMPSVVELRDGQTTCPNLLTEADLVGLMDKNGIGTPPCDGIHDYHRADPLLPAQGRMRPSLSTSKPSPIENTLFLAWRALLRIWCLLRWVLVSSKVITESASIEVSVSLS